MLLSLAAAGGAQETDEPLSRTDAVNFSHLTFDTYEEGKLTLDCAQVQAEQVIYLDDRPMFIEVADAMGIDGIHHTDFETTRRRLADFGLES